MRKISTRFIILLSVLMASLIAACLARVSVRSVAEQDAASRGALRGRILDRDGRALAVESTLYDISGERSRIDAKAFPAAAARLASILRTDPARILSRWAEGEGDFFYLARRVSPEAADLVREAKAAGGMDGLRIEPVPGRSYPEGRLASHLLGFVGDGNRGLAGIEYRYDAKLRGEPGLWRPAAPSAGGDVVLTIDAELQASLEALARSELAERGAESIVLLAADARGGEILAYVAMPDFDPNSYREFPERSWYDWAAEYAFEPGSLFKLFSMAALLDIGAIDEGTAFACDGSYRRATPSGGQVTIRDIAAHGLVDVAAILGRSCNSGAAQAADRASPQAFYERLLAFGFGSRTGAGHPGESSGSIRRPETWSLRSKPTIALGQEILVTALQTLSAAAAIADGGMLHELHTVMRATGAAGKRAGAERRIAPRRVMTAETSGIILAAMGRSATMAAIAGSAQMIDPATRRYSESDFISTALAFMPPEEPRFAIFGLVVKPSARGPVTQAASSIVGAAAEILLDIELSVPSPQEARIGAFTGSDR